MVEMVVAPSQMLYMPSLGPHTYRQLKRKLMNLLLVMYVSHGMYNVDLAFISFNQPATYNLV